MKDVDFQRIFLGEIDGLEWAREQLRERNAAEDEEESGLRLSETGSANLDNSKLEEGLGEEEIKKIHMTKMVQDIVLDTLRKVYYGELSPFGNVVPYVYDIKRERRLSRKLLYEIHPDYVKRLNDMYNAGPYWREGMHRVKMQELPERMEVIEEAFSEENKVWVKDMVAGDYKGWNVPGHPIFINTPTGTGKTSFVTRTLIPYALDTNCDVTIYVPRETLARQYEVEIERVLQEQGFQNIRELFNRRIYIETYQGLENKLAHQRNVEITDYTIIDECHSLLTDSVYNRNCTLSFAFFVNLNFASKTVFMSATGERIFDKLDKCILRTWTGCGLPKSNYLSFWYEGIKDYSYIDIHYLYDGWNIVDLIKSDTKNKWIVFVDSIQEGKKYCEELRKAKINAPFLHSDSKRKEADTFNSITMLNRFSEQVVISSSVLESGINIRDVKLKNIVVTGNNREQFLQMLGRKRAEDDERVNLYLDPKSKRHFEILLYQVRESKRRYDIVTKPNRYRSMEALSQDVVDNYIAGKTDISVFFTSHSPGMICNELCAEELNYLIESYGKIIDKFDREGEKAFLRTQLEWLELPEHEYEAVKENNEESVLRVIGSKIEKKIEDVVLKGYMLKEERKEFLKSLVPDVKMASEGRKYIAQGDIFSIDHFNEFCQTKGLPYQIRKGMTTPQVYYLEREESEAD